MPLSKDQGLAEKKTAGTGPAVSSRGQRLGQPFFTSGHSPLSIGRNASSPGMVRISL